MSSMGLAMEASLREHVHDTFNEAFGKIEMVAPSSSLHCSPLLKWRSRVKERRRGIEKEKEREREESSGEARHKRESERETERERVREREKKRKNFSILLQ